MRIGASMPPSTSVSASSSLATVIPTAPASSWRRAMATDLWVLKWGRSATPPARACSAIQPMLPSRRSRSTSRAGVSVAAQARPMRADGAATATGRAPESERRRADDDHQLGVAVGLWFRNRWGSSRWILMLSPAERVGLAGDLGEHVAGQRRPRIPRWHGPRATAPVEPPGCSVERQDLEFARSCRPRRARTRGRGPGNSSLVRRSRRTTISRWALPTMNWNIGTSKAWAMRRSELIDGSDAPRSIWLRALTVRLTCEASWASVRPAPQPFATDALADALDVIGRSSRRSSGSDDRVGILGHESLLPTSNATDRVSASSPRRCGGRPPGRDRRSCRPTLRTADGAPSSCSCR